MIDAGIVRHCIDGRIQDMKKALMVSTIIGFLSSFEINDIKILQRMGYEVHCACNCKNYTDKNRVKSLIDTGIVTHHIPFARSPLKKTNIIAYKALKKLIKIEKFDLVHCHTPVGGVLGRMAAYKNHVPVVMYTAHGFHFYDGAPLKNWIIFYPIEKYLSRYTDVLITINREDYKRAKTQFHAKKTVYIPGVGVDTDKYGVHYNGDKIRTEFEIGSTDIMLLSVGELNENKNHSTVIRALGKMKSDGVLPVNLCYVIVGKGGNETDLKQLISTLGLDDRIRLAGYRNDVADFYAAADIFVFPSYREGLSVSLMEAMANGLPVVCSRIRGNVDLIDKEGGFFFNPYNLDSVADSIKRCLNADRVQQGNHNFEKIKGFDIKTVEKINFETYGGVT